jgi:Na+-translocating ferredoxin:NAD+ oxidoreductase RnfD subunit
MEPEMNITQKKYPLIFAPFYQAETPLNPLYKKFLFPLSIAFFFGFARSGWAVGGQILCAWTGSFLVAAAFSKLRNKKIDQSFWITAFLLAGSIPVHLPFWMTFTGAAFGQFFAKEVFGGFGANIFNPALAARVFLTLNFPICFVTGWLIPENYFSGLTQWTSHSVTGPTPLMKFRAEQIVPDFLNSFTGMTGGSIFETPALLFIFIIIYMYFKKVGDFKFSFSFLISLAFFSSLGNFIFPQKILLPHIQLATGGILAGAAFFCTDPVTSPKNTKSKYLCGILLAILVLLIRSFSSFPEGFMYALLIINMFSPLIDQFFTNKK